MLSQRVQNLKPSPTLALAAQAKELKKKGHPVISLTVGEPDWPTYPSAKEAGIGAIQKDQTKYTPASGIGELREAIAQASCQWLQVPIKSTQVTVGPGAKFILYSAFNALLDPGDEVLIPSPYWVSYPTLVELAGGRPRIMETTFESQFKIRASDLEKSITSQTKALLINSPSNPTGAEYSQEELDEIASVLMKNPHVFLVSDDIYNQLSFHPRSLSPHLLHGEPTLFHRCIAVSGVSKSYSMTGWRIGWAVGPRSVIEALSHFQSQAVGAPCSISQWASLEAIQNCEAQVRQSLVQLKERCSFFQQQLGDIEGLRIFPPQGAFYLWVDIDSWLHKKYKGSVLGDSRLLSQKLLEDEKVAVVPGKEFGMEGYLRLSFAASQKDLQQAAQRLKNFRSQME